MKKSNTGFRNDDLFCFNCGRSFKLQLPQSVTMAAAIMRQFDKDHRNCEKTWQEPVPTPDLSDTLEAINRNAVWWLENGEHGISSKTMFKVMAPWIPLRNDRQRYPYDAGDFYRCYKLLQAVPQFKNMLFKLRPIHPVWSNLVDNWDKLTELLEQEIKLDASKKKRTTYPLNDLMKQLGC